MKDEDNDTKITVIMLLLCDFFTLLILGMYGKLDIWTFFLILLLSGFGMFFLFLLNHGPFSDDDLDCNNQTTNKNTTSSPAQVSEEISTPSSNTEESAQDNKSVKQDSSVQLKQESSPRSSESNDAVNSVSVEKTKEKSAAQSEDEEEWDPFKGTIYDININLEPVPPEPEVADEGEYVFDWYRWLEKVPGHRKAWFNNHIIEYDEAKEAYTVDKVIVPSIEKLVDDRISISSSYNGSGYGKIGINDKQNNIPLLDVIEHCENSGCKENTSSSMFWPSIKREYALQPATPKTGLLVAYFDGVHPIFAGRVDILLRQSSSSFGILNVRKFLKDYSYYRERIKLELNLYRLCLEQCPDIKISSLGCLHVWNHVEGYHTAQIDESRVDYIRSREVSEHKESYKKRKKYLFDKGPEYKVGQKVVYNPIPDHSYFVTVTNVDNEKGIVDIAMPTGRKNKYGVYTKYDIISITMEDIKQNKRLEHFG